MRIGWMAVGVGCALFSFACEKKPAPVIEDARVAPQVVTNGRTQPLACVNDCPPSGDP